MLPRNQTLVLTVNRFANAALIVTCTAVQSVVKANSRSNGTGQISTVSGFEAPQQFSVKFGTCDMANRCKVWGHSAVICAKTAEPIELPFGLWARMGPRNHMLYGVQIPHGKE